MVRKSGRSEEKETWYGEKYTQHYDSKGKESGTSKKEKDWLGQEKIQHYDPEGKRSGHSKEERNWLGEKKVQHYGSVDKRSDVDVSGYDRGNGSSSAAKGQTFFSSIIVSIGVAVYLSGLVGLLRPGNGLKEVVESYPSVEQLLSLLLLSGSAGLFLVLFHGIIASFPMGTILVPIAIWGLFAGIIPIPDNYITSIVALVAGFFIYVLSELRYILKANT